MAQLAASDENKDDFGAQGCDLCEMNWNDDKVYVPVFTCIKCNDGRFWCVEDGERKHMKKAHQFSPDYDKNPFVKKDLTVRLILN